MKNPFILTIASKELTAAFRKGNKPGAVPFGIPDTDDPFGFIEILKSQPGYFAGTQSTGSPRLIAALRRRSSQESSRR